MTLILGGSSHLVSKWLITMVGKFPIPGVVPLPNGHSWPTYDTGGPILQVTPNFGVKIRSPNFEMSYVI